MSDTETGAFASEVRDLADRYLDRADFAVGHAPTALAAYRTDPAAFHADVEQIKGFESECDDLLASLRTTLGSSMRPNFTGLYLQPGCIIDLLSAIDEIVNRVETFLTELAAIGPTLSADAHGDFVRMTDLTVEATSLLATAATSVLDAICSDPTDRSSWPAAGTTVAEIGRLESKCDAVRTKLLSDAFADLDTADALVVRELAVALDAAMDAVEDAADHLAYIESTALPVDGGDFSPPQ